MIVSLIADRNYVITVRLTHTVSAQGVLFAIGDITGGMVCWIENGFGEHRNLTGPAVPAGDHEVRL